MKKVLVTCDMPDSFLRELKAMSFDVDYKPGLTTDLVKTAIADYSGLVVSTPVKVDKEMLDTGKSLAFVARAGSGMENIDVEHASKVGIPCLSSPEGNRNAVAEHVVGMLLMLLNNLAVADAEVRNGEWRREENRGVELKGKNIGIIGYGNTGSCLAEKLSGFGMKILAFDKYKEGFGDGQVKEVELQEIFNEVDIVSFHVPLTDETRFWAGQEFFNSFNRNVILINSSRGGVVNTTELVAALRSGKIRGACLDVLEDEKITPSSKKSLKWFRDLTELRNVVLSPHIAGWTFESRERIGEVLLEKIRNVISGS